IYNGMFGPVVEAAKAAYAKPSSPIRPAAPAGAYAGHYANDFIGDAVVSGAGDGLVLKLGPAGARSYSLKHFDGDIFLTFPDAETPDRPAGVNFVVGPDGKASAVTIDFLDDNHMGTLRRVGD
ncbi:MAG: DUF3471 domain-containing protein, partial [Mesorhizobium sp.]